MTDAKKKSGCLRNGCLGCGAVAALGFVFFIVLVAIQVRNESREPVVERIERSQELPGDPFVFDDPVDTAPLDTAQLDPETLTGSDSPEVPQRIELPGGPTPEMLARADVASGRVQIDFSAGEFTIRPGEPGEPLGLEADFDSASFRVTEELIPEDDGSWTYKVKFGARGGWLGLIRGKETHNHVTLVLPQGRPLTLVGEIGLGESDVELGGLWLEHIDLDLGAGEHHIAFSEPTLEPVPEVRFEGSFGELDVRGLGNASPSKLLVRQSAGETRVDLAGAWRQDSDIDIRFGFGECRIRQPDNARIEIESASVSAGERRIDLSQDSLPDDAPRLGLRVSGTAGELRIN